MQEKACEFCSAPFVPRVRNQRFDKPACRVQSHQRANGRGETLRDRVLSRDGYACRRCGATEDDGRRLYARKVRGEKRTVENCETWCSKCNAIAARPNPKPKAKPLTPEQRKQRRREGGIVGRFTIRCREFNSRWKYNKYGNLTAEAIEEYAKR